MSYNANILKRKTWFVNIGTIVPSGSDRRQWKACEIHGFLSAGQGELYKNAITKLRKGNILYAYESGTGYLAIGEVENGAVRILDFKIDGKSLRELPYVNLGQLGGDSMYDHANSSDESEYIVKIKWLTKPMTPLYFARGQKGFYAPRSTVADMKNPDTEPIVAKYFGIEIL